MADSLLSNSTSSSGATSTPVQLPSRQVSSAASQATETHTRWRTRRNSKVFSWTMVNRASLESLTCSPFDAFKLTRTAPSSPSSLSVIVPGREKSPGYWKTLLYFSWPGLDTTRVRVSTSSGILSSEPIARTIAVAGCGEHAGTTEEKNRTPARYIFSESDTLLGITVALVRHLLFFFDSLVGIQREFTQRRS